MLEQYNEVFSKILDLTKERHQIYLIDSKKYPSSIIKLSDVQECPEYEEMDRRIFDYLDSLDYECIKVLQTIMYLGRDKDYDVNLTKDQIYINERKYMDDVIGWDTKEIDINQMLEKEPLNEYLVNGLKILGINHTFKYT